MTNLVVPSRIAALPHDEAEADLYQLSPRSRNVVAYPFAQRGRHDKNGGNTNTTKNTTGKHNNNNNNTNNNTTNNTNKASSMLMKPRPRSLSAGRSRHARGGDLVQNVYDRLGVKRHGGDWTEMTRPQSSFAQQQQQQQPVDALSYATEETVDPIISVHSMNTESHDAETPKSPRGTTTTTTSSTLAFHERFRMAATKTRGRNTTAATEHTAVGNKPAADERPRSLSRGRISQLWPPARQSKEEAEKEVPVPISPPRTQSNSKSWNNATSTRFSPVRSTLSPKRTSTANHPLIPQLMEDSKEETKAEEAAADGTAPLSPPPSLKDRLRAYSGSTSKTTTTAHRPNYKGDKQYAARFAVREHPPKIDIYDRRSGDEKKEDVEDIAVVPPPVVVVVEEPVKQHHQQRSIQFSGSGSNSNKPSGGSMQASESTPPPTRRTKNGGKIADVFLASIQATGSPKPTSNSYTSKTTKTTATSAPITEISAVEDPTGNDTASVAMSSVSGTDDFDPPPAATTTFSRHDILRKPSWQERNRVKPTTTVTTTSASNISPAMDAAMSKVIDERVQAQVADAETRLGAQMRRWMQQMDDKVLMRMEAMENKIQELQATVDQLQQQQQQQPSKKAQWR